MAREEREERERVKEERCALKETEPRARQSAVDERGTMEHWKDTEVRRWGPSETDGQSGGWSAAAAELYGESVGGARLARRTRRR